MDSYLSYNQVKLHHNDAPKTTFMINILYYYYEVMSFSHKRLMDTVFVDHNKCNLKAHINDLVVKTREEKKPLY